MKIITRAVLDWDGNVLEEDSYEYSGPVAQGKSSGSAPQPVDPYAQAAAQYGLATGTANYNAGLNRTDSSNPLGSNTWSVIGNDGGPSSSYSPGGGGYGPYPVPTALGGGAYGFGGPGPRVAPSGGAGGYPAPNFNSIASPPGAGGKGGTGGGTPPAMAHITGGSPSVGPGSYPSTSPPGAGGKGGFGGSAPPVDSRTSGGLNGGSGAPVYSQRTSLTPWANNLLQSPIDTSQIPGMPGGPSLQGNVNDAEQSVFNQQMQLLQPQQDQQAEQTTAQLEAQGAMPGSPAYEYGQKMLGLNQGAQRAQVANQAVTTGMGELPMLYGLGSTSLQNQLAERNAPISEYEALTGNPSANVQAATPDISGAFGQQYQGQLAGYNANTATNNANTSALAGLAGSAAMMFF